MNMLGALLVAVLIGAILPLQGLVNARLGTHIGGPVVAAFVSFLVGTVMLCAPAVTAWRQCLKEQRDARRDARLARRATQPQA